MIHVGAGEWHFHGGRDAPMVHVAVNGGGAPEWGDPVTDATTTRASRDARAETRETSVTEADVRELYRGAPEGFIGARDALAKRLRDEGRDGDAAEVKKLRRPTVAAWALDRLADDAPDTIEELLDAGAEFARAQRATLSGRDPQALRERPPDAPRPGRRV